MPVFSKDPEKQAAKEAARLQAVQERQQREQDEQARKAEAAFRASPQGRARTAKELGHRFFQISLPLSTTERTFAALVSGDKTMKMREIDPSDVLAVVESEGWRLDNTGYVFRETGSVSRDKLLSSGQTAAVSGEVIGIYLFRSAES